MVSSTASREGPSLAPGLTVREILGSSTLSGARVLAGVDGLGRIVQRLNVMEVPDILPWVKPREFLLTTAYPLRETPDALVGLLEGLDRRGLAGMGVKVGRYLEAVPARMLTRADDLGFPLVQLPDHVGFDEILNQVLTDILNRQAASMARAEQLHHALLQIVFSGGGLPEIAEAMAALLDCPVLVADGDGVIRASCGLHRVRTHLADAGLLDQRGDLSLSELSSGAVQVPSSPTRLVAAPVLAGPRHHGHIVAVDAARRLGDEDLLALENAATVAALAITKQLAVTAVESKFASDFLHDLLGGKVTGMAHAVARSRALGWDLQRPLVVMVVRVETTERTPRDTVSDRLVGSVTAAVRSRDAGAAVVSLSDEVVVLTGVPSGDDSRAAITGLAETVREEARTATREPVAVGASRAVDGPLQVVDAYEQAGRAVRVGRQVFGAGTATHFDDLGAFRLLSLIPDTDELTAFAMETLGAIASPDPASVELRRTLQVLLDTNLNIAEASRRLHVHYNTLRYRVDKLVTLVGPFPADPQLRLNLLLALQIWSLGSSGSR